MNFKSILGYVTILFVEDDDEVRNNIVQTLSYFTKKVYSASSAIEAFEKYNKYKPDIIISDIDMPQVNGIEFIKKVRENDRLIPIIILTAYKTEEYLFESIPLHLESYIIKPVSYTNLKNVLQSCVDRLKELNRIEVKFKNNYSYNLVHKILQNENGQIIKLQNKEQLLLDLLIQNTNEITYYYEIEQYVWNGESLNKDSLKTLIGKLRNKIGRDTILNELEQGYRLVI